jgi:hypothetical protein
MRSILALLGLWASLLHIAAAQTQILLVASTPFGMLLQPTATKLDVAALQAIKDALSFTLLITQVGNAYLDMQVVFQEVDLLPIDATKPLPSTSLRFFVLATTVIPSYGTLAAAKGDLDTLIAVAFLDSVAKKQFMSQLDSNPLLQNVTQVDVAVVPPSNSTTSTTKARASTPALSSLDIALITISLLIFLGILYMVIEHHKDRGWLETQRMFTANEASHAVEHHPSLSMTPTGSKVVEVIGDNQARDASQSPTKPSTPVSDVGQTSDAPPTNACCPSDLPTLPLTAVPLLSPSSQDVSYGSNCFHESPSKSRSIKDGGTDGDEASDSELQANNSSASSDDDVFGIDMNALPSKDTLTEEDKSRTSSVTSTFSEWMKSTRVVSSTKPTTMTHSSNNSTASMAESSSVESSLDQLSLEESMADSSLGESQA